MTNIPPGDNNPPGDPRPLTTNPNRRGHIAIGVVVIVVLIAAIFYFSSASQDPDNPAQTAVPGEVSPDADAGQGEDTSATPPATAPAENSGTTTQ